MRPLLVRHLALVLAVALAPCASAQAPRDSTRGIPTGCTYATCALRLEPMVLATPALVRGVAGEQVGRVGLFGGEVDPLLAGPDSAAHYARDYVRAVRTSTVLSLLGTAALVVALGSNHWRFTNPSAGVVTVAAVGTGLSIASIPFGVRASRSLARSVWWYNAAIPR
jgi:hypothetical protein